MCVCVCAHARVRGGEKLITDLFLDCPVLYLWRHGLSQTSELANSAGLPVTYPLGPTVFAFSLLGSAWIFYEGSGT